ncbi:acyltransferase [Rhodovastum atsumiense]|uniref:Acyltransferase n=2 Tax=Rhodovastum atsumiense TaxID=504468 RepID=A0A5M6INE5_9PROT|nr:acyltransferase [Rhodovastum atsumiense]
MMVAVKGKVMKLQMLEHTPSSIYEIRNPSAAHFQSIQMLRAIAAILVVLVHVNPFGYSFVAGHIGVDIFFVISCFIIGTTGINQSRINFFAKRLIRIVPLYWAVTALMCRGFPGARNFE